MRCVSLGFACFFFGCTLLSAQTVTTIASDMRASGGVSVGLDGNAYVADFGVALSNANGNIIYRVTPTGEVTTYATIPLPPSGGRVGASGNAFDADGNLLQSNISAGRISKIEPNGTISTLASANILGPVGVTVDSQGNVYATSCRNGAGALSRVTPAGSSTIFVSNALLSCPNGLTIDDEDNLYTCNFNNGNVIKVTPAGEVSRLATVPGGGNGHLTFANGRLYVNSWQGHRIYEVTLEGDVRPLVGSGLPGQGDGSAETATFFRPNGISASVTGDTLYVNDTIPTAVGNQLHTNAVRMITGILETTTTALDAETVPWISTLQQNHPNPFHTSTTLSYRLAEPASVTLAVYDVLGQVVRTLAHGMQSAGTHQVHFSGDGLADGLYIYQLKQGRHTETRTMILSR